MRNRIAGAVSHILYRWMSYVPFAAITFIVAPSPALIPVSSNTIVPNLLRASRRFFAVPITPQSCQ